MGCAMKLKLGVLCLLYVQVLFGFCEEATQDHSITIFVHGTYFMRKFFQYSPCRHLMYCPQGLTLAKYLPNHYHFYKIAQGCAQHDQNSYHMDQFYVFGWESERVNDANRNKSAKILVEQIYELVVDYYLRYDIIPKVRLIGYSHGGNVVLHTANYFPQYADLQNLDVEAWLFATPVQVINHDLVNSDCFSAIYSVYSKKDIIQKIDPQGLSHRKITKNHFWSDRTFCQNSRCVQVDFTVNGHAIGHSDFNELFPHFPKIKRLIEEKYDHHTRQESSCGKMIEVDFKMPKDNKGLPK